MGSQRNCRKCDEVNVNGSSEDTTSYGVPKEMRKVLGEGGCMGILGMMGAGRSRAEVVSQSTDEKKR